MTTAITEKTLIGVTKVHFDAASVTCEFEECGWVATKWERGLPVARTPISVERLLKACNANKHYFD
jgi:hypothetical protein